MIFSHKSEPVEVQGQTLHVREMSGLHFGEFLKVAQSLPGYETVLHLVLFTAVDAAGKYLFGSKEEVGNLPRSVIDALADVASKVNGLGDKPDDTKSVAQ